MVINFGGVNRRKAGLLGLLVAWNGLICEHGGQHGDMWQFVMTSRSTDEIVGIARHERMPA